MRKIPTTMATQHPDNAGRPYWHAKAFISTSAELKECFLCFKDLGIDEYNWDWEGKFVDEAVVDRLLHQHLQYFQNHPLGKDKFLTFRFPNPRVEKQFRLARALMVVVTSSQLAKNLGFKYHPIFEAILPLTETAEEIINIQEAFHELVSIEHRLLKMDESIKHIELIPLFEQVETILNSDRLLNHYISLHKTKFGKKPQYIRPYCARSDPALNSGLVPTILALKVALSSYTQIEKDTGVKLYPMLGTGSLPFRGGLNPDTIENCLEEYAGVSTLIVQSAFRYDYPLSRVKKAINQIQQELPKRKAKILSDESIKAIRVVIPYFEIPYKTSIEKLATIVNKVSDKVLRRRERMLHIGLFGYSRGVGKVRLPRAISFCASLYSLGLPPEIIGLGRGIKKAVESGVWKLVAPYYIHLKDDIRRAGYYLNKENVAKIGTDVGLARELAQDITFIEEQLEIELGPKDPEHFEHYQLTKKIYQRLKDRKEISQLITFGGLLRHSLG